PGNVGGAVFMNAGAYGREIKDIAVKISYIEDNELKEIDASECDFGYRTSLFEKKAAEGSNIVITKMTARLRKGDKDKIEAYVSELREKRTKSQPLDVPSAGSTFKRPEGYYAGALIEGSGLKGFKLDESGAQVSPKHAGFVVNNGGTASASDVMRLIRYVQDKVYEDSNVRLRTEVRIVGKWE
ncbi:MAG: UDP-N-acetylmuramate dehydrogenase, partial [Clostridiales bacterium]|nr:UDP-N-acetylmuramate dehydrogenase [Clostridiales bacterium]